MALPRADALSVILYSNGDRFEGQLSADQKREGTGWYFYQNGDIYFGQWRADIKEGFGIMHYRSGDRYVGQFAGNKKSGFGEYTYAASGDRYQGFWVANNKCGFGRIISPNGNEFRGSFKANKKDGKGFLSTRGGKVFLQIWNNDTFVKQQVSDKESICFGEFQFDKVIDERLAARDPGIMKQFAERMRAVGVKMVPDAPESLVKQSAEESQLLAKDQRSNSLRSAGLSAKPSRVDSLSLIDYTDRLKSLFDERELRNVKQWGSDKVCSFLGRIGLGEYSLAFENAGITGDLMLKMTDTDFKSLGITPRGDLIKATDYIEKLKILTNQDEYRRSLLNRKLIPESVVSEKLISRYDVENDKMIEEKSWESSESDVSRKFGGSKKFRGQTGEGQNGAAGRSSSHPLDQGGALTWMMQGKQEQNHTEKLQRWGSNEKIESPAQAFVFDAFETKIKRMHSFNLDHEPAVEIESELSAKKEDEEKEKRPDRYSQRQISPVYAQPPKPLKHSSLSSDSDEDPLNALDVKSYTLRTDYPDPDGFQEEMLRISKKRSTNRRERSIRSSNSNSTLAKKYVIQRKNFTLDTKLQEGAFGLVYKGTYLHQKVAIKVYKKLENSRFHVHSFLKEVEILSRLRHPDVLLYMGVCIDGDDCFMISEYLENGSLYDHLHGKKRKDPLDPARIHELLKGILRAMMYIHGKGIVHCDLKSSNILIDDSWTIKLADFGLSKKIIGVNVLDKTHQSRVGTPNWMAPEICRGESYTPKADVYSFGLVVWEIVMNAVPFGGKGPLEILELVGRATVQPVR